MRYPTQMSGRAAWTILKKLGEGGSGSVYLARSPSGQNIAVKLLLAGVEIQTLEREAALLTRLKHPGIAAVHGYLKNSSEIFGQDRGPCSWMEYVDGPDVVGAARSLKTKREESILRWFVQSIEALDYLHRENVIHGDLTPQNLRIGVDGNLKIIDFGFASIGRTEIPPDGTLLYMSPERFQGIQDEAGDLFSLGTVFYEALAGVHPREGRRSLTEMFQKPPKSLTSACPALSRSFPVEARIIDALISSRPTERFGSAQEVVRALQAQTIARRQRGEAYVSRIFYGADEGLQAMEAALAAMSRKLSWIAVHGTTGTGRTRFLKEIAFRGSLAGHRIVDVPPDDFSKGIARMEDPSSIPAILIFRSLDKVPRPELPGMLFLHQKETRKGAAVFEWNDDLMEAESRRLILNSPLALRWTEVTLKNLDEGQVQDFLSRGLGEAVAGEVKAELFAATRGNPRLLGDWVSFFKEKGWSEKSHFPKDWLASAGAPLSVEALLQARWQGLDALERSVLEALAIDGGPAALEELLEVVRTTRSSDDEDLGSWRAIEVLSRLQEEDLVTAEADSDGQAVYRIALEPLVPLAKQGIDQTRGHMVHAAWLNALRGLPDSNVRKVRHLIALQKTERFIPAMESLTETLRKNEQQHEALRRVQEALAQVDSTRDAVSASRLLRMKINLLNDLGRYREALEACEENLRLAAADEPPALKRVKYWILTGVMHENLGNLPDALRRFQNGLQEAEGLKGGERVVYLVRSHTLIGKRLFSSGDRKGAVAHFETAKTLSSSLGRERAEADRNLAVVRAEEGQWDEAMALLREAIELYRSDPYYPGEFAVCLLKGNLAIERGDSSGASEAYAAAEAVATTHKDDLLLARVWNNQGVLARKTGDLALASDRCRRSLEVFRAIGNPADLAESLKQHAVTQAELGRFMEAERLCRELRDMAEADARWVSKAEEARRVLERLRDGDGWDFSEETVEKSRERLEHIYNGLPKALQVSFVDRFDYRKFVLNI